MATRFTGLSKGITIFRIQPLGTKVLLIAVFIFGAGSLCFGAFAISQNVVSPFTIGGKTSDEILEELLPKADDATLASKTKDTDSDGLTDYDEVALYSTSPYLSDSDSDGVADSTEIQKGTDPNCKPGETCLGLRLVTPDTKISDLFPQFSTSDVTLKDKTVQEFRQILVEQGFDKASLDKISDNTLLIMLEESLKAQDQETSTSTPSSEDEITAQDYDNIRLLLIDMGVPRDEVYSMSNEDVANILRTLK